MIDATDPLRRLLPSGLAGRPHSALRGPDVLHVTGDIHGTELRQGDVVLVWNSCAPPTAVSWTQRECRGRCIRALRAGCRYSRAVAAGGSSKAGTRTNLLLGSRADSGVWPRGADRTPPSCSFSARTRR